MGSKKKKKDATYQAAVSGAKGAIRILLYVLLICILIFVGKTAYSFGYLIFYQEPEADTQAEGQDVTVIVHGCDVAGERTDRTTGHLLGTGKTLRLPWQDQTGNVSSEYA